MEPNKVYIGNALDVLKTFQDKSINCVVSSPPYWQMRQYEGIPDYIWPGPNGVVDCNHDFDIQPLTKSGGSNGMSAEYNEERKISTESGYCKDCCAWKGQLGLEPNFHLYIDHMMLIMNEIYRVLKDDGTVWWNLGDTYGTQSGQSRGVAYDNYRKDKENLLVNVSTGSALLKGNLPQKSMLMIPHRFAIKCTDNGWILRNTIIWGKRNSMPESVQDRLKRSHEYIFFMVKSKKYYFDLDSIRDKAATKPHKPGNNKADAKTAGPNDRNGNSQWDTTKERVWGENGRNPGDVIDFWDIPTKASSNEHYASYNPDLINKPILAGCPEGGIVLDPFFGTGTTGIAARYLGRNYIGIEGSKKYYDIAVERLKSEDSGVKESIIRKKSGLNIED